MKKRFASLHTTNKIALAAALALVCAATGCSGEAGAIERLKALNDKLVADGGEKAVLMQMDGKQVGTMIVQSNLDEVLPNAAKLRKVTEIYLGDTDFEDRHVQFVKGISSLKSLVVGGTNITDAGVRQLAQMDLETLEISGTAITPMALEAIGEMSALRVLDLSETNIQSNLAPLAQLENLEWLLLRDMDLSGLSEASIDALTRLTKLGRLTATNSNMSEEAVKRLKNANPALNLELGDSPASDDGMGAAGSAGEAPGE